jgi:hypothetical protein
VLLAPTSPGWQSVEFMPCADAHRDKPTSSSLLVLVLPRAAMSGGQPLLSSTTVLHFMCVRQTCPYSCVAIDVFITLSSSERICTTRVQTRLLGHRGHIDLAGPSQWICATSKRGSFEVRRRLARWFSTIADELAPHL